MSDDKARVSIVENVDKNYFVEAGAGSGKTTILVERMVSMVEKGIPVDQICTITFTKAAANEFYERFQRRLSQRSGPKPESGNNYAGRLGMQTETTMERCQTALQNIDSCFMGTIDAFCNTIISEHPLEAGVPANSTVLEDSKIIDLYLTEYSKILSTGDYSADLQKKCQRFINTQVDTKSVFTTLLPVVLKLKDAEFVYEPVKDLAVEAQYAELKHGLLELIDIMEKDPELPYTKNKDCVSAWEKLKARRNYLEKDWDKYFSRVMEALKKKDIENVRINPVPEIEKIFGKTCYFLEPNPSDGKKIKWYQLSAENIIDPVIELNDYKERAALDFVVTAVKEISPKLRQRGELSFFDYKLYLRDMLKEDVRKGHKLIDHIFKRHSYFLIDEFQDTDPMQAEIFFYLAAKEFNPDWRKCVPHPGSLFIVGDPKQSIYRFKNADVASFKNVRSLFKGESGEVVQLTSNFRSTYTLHQWFNKVFGEHLLKEDTEDQSRYEPITNRSSEDEELTGVYTYDPGEEDAKTVRNIITTLVNNPDYKIVKKQGEEKVKKMIEYSDIMIITWKKSQLLPYVTCFSEHGIPFKVEGDINLKECSALMDLVVIFNAVAYPRNNLYLYGAMISRVFDIDEKTAMEIKEDLSKTKEIGEFVSGNVKIRHFIETISKYRAQSDQVSPSTVFANLMDDLNIFAVCGNHNLEYVYYVLEILRDKEASGEISSVQEAADYIGQLMSKEVKVERCVSLQKNYNRVHMANLHKVKGLEAPVVILAGPQKTKPTNRVEKRVEYDGDTPKCYLFNIKGTDMYKEKEKVSNEAEHIRLLYVAATRAKQILIMANKEPWVNLSRHVGYDFFEEFEARKEEEKKTELADGKRLYETAECVINEQSASRTPSVHFNQPSSSDEVTYEQYISDSTPANMKHDPKLVGTLVHKLMERIVSSRNKCDIGKIIQSILQGEEQEYTELLTEVANQIQNGGYPQENGSDPDILGELLSANEVYCELPFSYKISDDTVESGVIDVLYRKGQKWFIVDYKTNADGTNLDEKYKKQLKAYAKAFEAAKGKPVDARIYHIGV